MCFRKSAEINYSSNQIQCFRDYTNHVVIFILSSIMYIYMIEPVRIITNSDNLIIKWTLKRNISNPLQILSQENHNKIIIKS